ncbi:MAG TPA: 2-dehydropantoate 2-reductase N-terminal domain-containing protein [Euzebyales bacterium]|nr:2-dehydropantoate 2-reductase N-terminal domain-containing protein [Euzebyales bacterium]
MRFVVHGAGAVGGLVGARLHHAGRDVVLIARGAHREAMAAYGLRLDTPDGSVVLALPVVDHPGSLEWRAGDVVLLCVKSQDTAAALADLEATAPPDVPIVCLQNGVANEPAALRRFADVYGGVVMTPAAFIEPGVVIGYSAPTAGIIDVGRFPRGVGDLARDVRAALASAGFSSQPVGEIRRWKYRKLLSNLGNAAEALCGRSEAVAEIGRLATAEGETVLAAAGIEVASRDEDARRRADWIRIAPVAGRPRPGGSSWQSLHRATGSIETDYLNGEIVLLGRLHDVPTPCNGALRRLARRAVVEGWAPGALPVDELRAQLGAPEG